MSTECSILPLSWKTMSTRFLRIQLRTPHSEHCLIMYLPCYHARSLARSPGVAPTSTFAPCSGKTASQATRGRGGRAPAQESAFHGPCPHTVETRVSDRQQTAVNKCALSHKARFGNPVRERIIIARQTFHGRRHDVFSVGFRMKGQSKGRYY